MYMMKAMSYAVAVALGSGCATYSPTCGPGGPELEASVRASESGQYAAIGLEFTTWGDFAALVSPTRWKSPITTGGTLSWLNPGAWREDAGRTGRILLGEAVLVGGVTAAATASDGGSGGGAPSVDGGSGDDGGSPTPPPGSGGSVPPPPET